MDSNETASRLVGSVLRSSCDSAPSVLVGLTSFVGYGTPDEGSIEPESQERALRATLTRRRFAAESGDQCDNKGIRLVSVIIIVTK